MTRQAADMTGERRDLIDRLCSAALAQPEEVRERWLRDACQAQPGLYDEVESLLRYHEDAETFLEAPALELAAAELVACGDRLDPGSFLGHYEIKSLIGAGGMGDVYRARDTELHREVAIKVLPHVFADDAERVARFEREAHVLASLNHPHIAAIFGLAQAGEVRALVMELVEGITLAERIAQGPIPVDEALSIAHQITQALEAAHDRGVIHRDLKPSNVKLTPQRRVKLLDFGVAAARVSRGIAATDDSVTHANAAAFSSPTAAAHDVLLLGTAAYTSPEQARGKPVDARADVWAFGCVLYEMLTGARAFQGGTAAEVLEAVLERDVDWTLLPATTPTYVRWLLQQCLQRDLTERFRDIGDARLLLVTAIEARKNPSPAGFGPNRVWWLAGLATVAVATLTAWMATARATPSSSSLKIFDVSETSGASPPALSPDGLMVAYRRPDGLWVRRLDSATPTRIVTAPDVGSVAWAPTGDALGYFVGANVHVGRVDGTEQRIVWRPTERMASSRPDVGLAWSGNSLYLPVTIPAGGPAIARVPLGGGEPLVIRPVNNTPPFAIFRSPVVLDGGETILVNPGISGEDRFDFGTVWALRGTQAEQVLSFPESTVAGIAYLRQARALLVATNDNQRNALWAAAFDPERLTASEPRPILDGLWPAGPAANGDIALITGVRPRLPLLRRFDAAAREVGVFPQHHLDLRNLELAPGGRYLALRAMSTLGSGAGLWIYDLERAVETFVAPVRGVAMTAWSPDAQRLAVTHWTVSDSEGALDIVDVSSGQMRRVASSVRGRSTWTPDGKRLLFVSGTGSGSRLLSVPTDGQGATEPQAVASIEWLMRVSLSPSGRILAYVAGPPGRAALMVAPFPALSPRHQVADEVVQHLQWSPRGDELWFDRDNQLLAVPVATTRARGPTSGTERVLFKPPPGLSLLDSRRGRVFATRDGKEFWIADQRFEGEPRISVIQNIEPLVRSTVR